ncbi:MAG: o-succinylbenzoate--CoA ligase [Ignavibacteriales bacterium]|nr:o-succinylbenzoate--CoA ligase [Ignavibacteriales bacterium]
MNSKSIDSLFNFSSRKDLTAIIKSDKSISYQKLFANSNKIAHSFLSSGIKKNNYIPICIEDQLKFIETTIAIWNLGAIPVPINTKLLDDEISSLIKDYNFRFLITDKDLSINLLQKDLELIELNKISISNSAVTPFSHPDLNSEAVVVFTSGSSSRPKGVVHTFSSLINSIENGNQILLHQEKDRWLASLPFYHIGGFQIICRSLFYGCSIAISETLKTYDLVTAITKLNPTHISLVSAQLLKFIHLELRANQSLQVTLVGGGFIEDNLIIEANNLGWKPVRVYGSSETASMITAISADEIKTKPHSVGKSLNNVEINISNESEILIKSNSLFKQYLDDEKETDANLVNGFYHSGDLGYVDEEGYLFIEARRNDLIVTGGENVNSIEVEKAILRIEGIRDTCVFSKQDKTWGQIIACALVIDDSELEENIIKEKLRQKLAGFKIPKQFYFTDKLPRTSLGKLEREKIRKMF